MRSGNEWRRRHEVVSYFIGTAVGFIAACILSVAVLNQKAEDGTLLAGKYRITLEDKDNSIKPV